jgi:chaperonin GroEL (HSP60 family)
MTGPITRIEKNLAPLYKGVSDISSAVASTMGAGGRSALLYGFDESDSSVTNDGWYIINRYRPADPVEAAGVRHVKNAAEATMRNAGDGTSTTCVLMSAFMMAALNRFREKGGEASWDYLSGCDDACAAVQEALVGMADGDVTLKVLEGVTAIAMHGSADAKKVAGLVHELGADASVMVDMLSGGETWVEKIPGFRWASGVPTSDFFTRNGAAVYNDCAIVALWDEVVRVEDLEALLVSWNRLREEEGRMVPLVIFARSLQGDALLMV